MELRYDGKNGHQSKMEIYYMEVSQWKEYHMGSAQKNTAAIKKQSFLILAGVSLLYISDR